MTSIVVASFGAGLHQKFEELLPLMLVSKTSVSCRAYDFYFFTSRGLLENEVILTWDPSGASGAFPAGFNGCWKRLCIKGYFDFLWVREALRPFLFGE